jgi:hypothetical protein
VLSFAAVRRVFVARSPQDLRRGIDALSGVVSAELGADPYAGDCFVFVSRDRRKLKALVWEPGGFWLCLKRLETGTFADWSSRCAAGAASVSVSPAEMHALLEGIDVRHARYRRRQPTGGEAGECFGKYARERRAGDPEHGPGGRHRRRHRHGGGAATGADR